MHSDSTTAPCRPEHHSLINVLHLIKSLGRGGAETLLSETLRVHDRDAFAFQYAYFVSYKGQLAEDLREQGARVSCLNGNSASAILARLPALARLVKEENIDLIHCHLPVSAAAGRLVGKYLGVPVVYTEHNKQERYHPATRRLNLATMGLNAEVLTVSEDVRQSLLAHWSGDKRRVSVLINGVNTSRYNPAQYDQRNCREELGLPAEAPIVGTVCVFRTQKRLECWLDLAARTLKEIPDAYFVVIGDGPTEEQVKARAKALGLLDRIRFPGRLDEVRQWLAAMDVYLMTSEFEGLAHRPAGGNEYGTADRDHLGRGIAEAVTDGTEGFVLPVDEWENLLPPLVKLLRDADLRQKTGKAARERVIRDFSIERMARELEAVYRRVSAADKSNRA